MELKETTIVEFFKNRGVDPHWMRTFMRFLIEHNSYTEFITDLTMLMRGEVVEDPDAAFSNRVEDWIKWANQNILGKEYDIINRFLIWSLTLHPQLWHDLNLHWRDFYENLKMRKKIFKKNIKSFSL